MAQNIQAGRWVALAGGVLAAFGATMPWLSIEILGATESVRGVWGDGIVVLAAGFMVAAGVVWGWNPGTQSLAAIFGVIVLGIGVLHLVDPLTSSSFETVQQRQLAEQYVELSRGLYASTLGGAAMLVGGAIGLSGLSADATEGEPQPAT